VAVYRGVFLYGDSGNGKSSLVNAGLLPQARRLGFEPVRVRVQPRAGEEVVIEPIEISDDGAEILPSPLVPEADGPSRVVLSIAEFEQRVRAASQEHRPLLVFDQFEEILTLFEDEQAAAVRDALAELILRLLGDPLPVKLLFAFREDYLGRVKQLLAARPELVDQALRLGPPSDDSLETIIRGPFERFPGRFEPELDPELAQRLRAALSERFGTGEVSLSEVQTVCLRLWESADPAALLAAKGVQGVLEDELGEALDAFPADLRAAAIALLGEMVTSAGTRNVISAEDLRFRVREEDEQIPPALLDEALDRLDRESKLVRRERRRDLYLYEITSEFLVPWISRRREELRLVRERRRERRRLMRILALIGGGLLILAAIVVGFVVSVDRQRALAQRQASEATSLALAASSVEALRTRPDAALALAFEGYLERRRPETHAAVVRALVAARRSGLRGVLNGPASPVLAFSRDGRTLAAGGVDGTVCLWNPTTHRQLDRLTTRHNGRVNAFALSPDGETLAAGGVGGTIGLWSTTTHKHLADLGSHNQDVNAIAFSPDGKTLAAVANGTIRLWNPTTHRQLGRLSERANAIAFSPDGKTLAAAGYDGTIRLWNPTTRKQVGRVTAYEIRAADFAPPEQLVIAFSPDGKSLAAASGDRIRLWNAATRKHVADLGNHNEYVNAIAFSPDGKTLAAAGYDGTIRLWNPNTHKQFIRFATPTQRNSYRQIRLRLSPDGRTLAVSSSLVATTIRLWNLVTHRRAARLTNHLDYVNALAFSPTGKFVAAGDGSGTIQVWNTATQPRGRSDKPRGMHTPLRISSSVFELAFSPDGKTLATGDSDGKIRLWNLSTGKQVAHVTNHVEYISVMSFSPSGSTLAYVGDDDTIRLWTPTTHKPPVNLSRNTSPVYALVFSPDGSALASAGADGTVRLWSPTTHKQLGRLTGYTSAVGAVAFSPHGKTLAAAGYDGTIRLWDAATHQQLGAVTGHTNVVDDVAFSPNGKTLVSASSDGTVRIWSKIFWRTLAELRTTVCDIIGTGLTRSEWTQYAPGIPYHRTCP
jgi:WD40 repeat protein